MTTDELIYELNRKKEYYDERHGEKIGKFSVVILCPGDNEIYEAELAEIDFQGKNIVIKRS